MTCLADRHGDVVDAFVWIKRLGWLGGLGWVSFWWLFGGVLLFFVVSLLVLDAFRGFLLVQRK